MSEKKKAVLEDIKAIKYYILAVIGFAGGVSGFLIKIVNFPEAPTLLGAGGLAVGMLVIGFLIQRSESRQESALHAHIVASDTVIKEMRENMLENRRSNLRTEMNLMMYTLPENHDTILKMAYRYFVELKGDWVETDLFLNWVESEEEAGRRVHIPAGISEIVMALQKQENS